MKERDAQSFWQSYHRGYTRVGFHDREVRETGLGEGPDSEPIIHRGGRWSGLEQTQEPMTRVRDPSRAARDRTEAQTGRHARCHALYPMAAQRSGGNRRDSASWVLRAVWCRDPARRSPCPSPAGPVDALERMPD